MNEASELCCVMGSSEQGEILLAFDLPINSFIKLCEELKDTDIRANASKSQNPDPVRISDFP